MRYRIQHTIKGIISATALLFGTVSYAQQWVIADKDVTRPAIAKQYFTPSMISSFTVTLNNGYNEVRWSTVADQAARRFTVEYSTDMINFQSAGEAMATNGTYQLRHPISLIEPLAYRVRVEDADGRFYYSRSIQLEDIASPVKIYPTTIQGNVVNVVSQRPVDRITVYSGNGQQVFVQEPGGKADYMTVTIPTLPAGIYWMNFAGSGWKKTEKFIVP